MFQQKDPRVFSRDRTVRFLLPYKIRQRFSAPQNFVTEIPSPNANPFYFQTPTTSQGFFNDFVSSSFLHFPQKIRRFSRENSMGKSGLLDLEKHFAFYGAYHSNSINILIHTLFVWPIFFTSLILFYFTPPVYDLSDKVSFFPSGLFSHALVLNFGFLFTLIYALFYFCLDKKAGSLAALLCFSCWIGASLIANRLGFSVAWKVFFFFGLFSKFLFDSLIICLVGEHLWEK